MYIPRLTRLTYRLDNRYSQKYDLDSQINNM